MRDEVYDDAKIREKIAKGDAALRVLNDPVVRDAYSGIEEHYIEQLLQTEPEDDELRWKLVCKVNALRDVQQVMTSVITTAKKADKRRRTREE